MLKLFVFTCSSLFFCCCTFAQTVIIDGTVGSINSVPVPFKDYWAELRSDDSTLIEKQRINSAGNFTFQLKFAHDYYIGVRNKEETIWQLIVKNRMEREMIHYPVFINISPVEKSKDVYEVTVDKDGNKKYLKNGMPITEITYNFETTRRDSSEIIRKE
ncbi:MAG: hypothetical protein KIS94_15835 [Chitinophagales bacterium]|nr:hypothetical protein [Chitinophagales bacterium]